MKMMKKIKIKKILMGMLSGSLFWLFTLILFMLLWN